MDLTSTTAVNEMQAPHEQNNRQQQVVGNGNSGMTPEQEEEMKLRMKYPNPQKPGGSTFIQKMLHKGNKKYFDSGDYNMAKSRTKAALNNNNAVVTMAAANNGGQLIAQQKVSEESMPSIQTPESTNPTSPNIIQNNILNASTSPQAGDSSPSTIFSSPATIVQIDNNAILKPELSTTPNIITTTTTTPTTTTTTTINTSTTPTIVSYHHHQFQQQPFTHHHQHQHTPLSTNMNIINHGSNETTTHHITTTPVAIMPQQVPSPQQQQQQQHQHLSASTSSSSINMMISSSLSSDKLSNIQLNPDALLLDSEEIGHGIPTPECLPQSRKHSMTQSKLATPRLSTS